MIKLYICINTLPVPAGFTGTTIDVYMRGVVVFTTAVRAYLLVDATVEIVGFSTEFIHGIYVQGFTLPFQYSSVHRYYV